MIRPLLTSALVLGLLAAACGSSDRSRGNAGSGGTVSTDGTSGTGDATTGGSGGTVPTGGGGGTVSTGGTSGTGGATTGGSGGTVSTGGTSGAGVDSGEPPSDGPMSIEDGPTADASSGDGGYDPGGDPFPGGARPYIHLCKPEWTPMQCCAFLCDCVDHLCTDSPQDAPYIPKCLTMCAKLTPARARCQVFHCFESKSPTAVADHASHCGHATGRVGGGSCAGVP